MQIDKKTVDELAQLARLDFKDEAKEEIINDLNKILDFVDKLNELDTENMEPLIYMSEETNRWREDEVKQTVTQDEGLKNAPKHDSDYFKSPKVIDNPNE